MRVNDFNTKFKVLDGFDSHGVTHHVLSIKHGGADVLLNCTEDDLEDLERKIHQAIKGKDKYQENAGDILSGLVSIANDMKDIVASNESRISMLEDKTSNPQK